MDNTEKQTTPGTRDTGRRQTKHNNPTPLYTNNANKMSTILQTTGGNPLLPVHEFMNYMHMQMSLRRYKNQIKIKYLLILSWSHGRQLHEYNNYDQSSRHYIVINSKCQ